MITSKLDCRVRAFNSFWGSSLKEYGPASGYLFWCPGLPVYAPMTQRILLLPPSYILSFILKHVSIADGI